MLKRLEEKGLTQKQEDPDNRSKLLISLTALGNTAYWAHKHWHETMDSGFICRYRFFRQSENCHPDEWVRHCGLRVV